MATLIKSEADFKNFIKNQVIPKAKLAMDNDIMPLAEKVTKKHIEKEVYNSYQPTQYRRTDDLLNSLLADKSEVHGDTIMGIIRHFDELGHHYSLVGNDAGNDVDVQDLAGWINRGEIHNFWNDDWSYPFLRPAPYFWKAEEEMKRRLPSIVKKSFRKQGLKVT